MKENKTAAKIAAETAVKKKLVLDYNVTFIPAARYERNYGVKEQLIVTFLESKKPYAVIHCDNEKSVNKYANTLTCVRRRKGYKIGINRRGADLYLTNLEVGVE